MNIRRSALAVILAIALVGLLVAACQPAPAPNPEPLSVYGSTVYFPPGGSQLVVASGGEVEVRSGATLDIQSGSTAQLGAYTIGWSDPITVSGVLTNVRILYYQVP